VWETPKGPRATSGVLATGGNLVFMGNSGGKELSAYNAKTGAKLWTYDAQTAVLAAPITYELDGVQYIAASVGGTAGGDYFAPAYARMLVFKVGGKVKLPPNAPYTARTLNPPASTASTAVIAHGSVVYADNCAICHGADGTQQRGSNAPLLTTSPLLHVQQGFDQVVLQGGRVDRGMMNFAGKLTAADSAAVLAYVVSRANQLKNAQPAAAGGRGGPAAAPAAAPAPQRDIHEDAAPRQ
jgi:mono/diheme cytochrome c family protein